MAGMPATHDSELDVVAFLQRRELHPCPNFLKSKPFVVNCVA